MGKYSSESENEKHGSKNSSKSRNRRSISNLRRSSSSDSSISKRRRGKKSICKSRSRSRDKYSRSRRSRSSSTSTYRSSKSKSYRCNSKDRNRHKDHRRSRSRSRTRHRARRSRSKSYIREYIGKPRKRSSSSSSSSSNDRNKKPTRTITTKNENTICQNIKTRNSSPDCVIIDSEVLDEINDDTFAPKQFISKSKVPENILIDLKKNTIKVPEVEPLEPDSIFHHNLTDESSEVKMTHNLETFFGSDDATREVMLTCQVLKARVSFVRKVFKLFLNEEARMEKWIKELYSYRQKALQQGLRNN